MPQEPTDPALWDRSDAPLGDVLFEMAALGNFVKVSAIDPISNTEVCIVGSTSMSPYFPKMSALRKLKRVLAGRGENEKEQPITSRRAGLWA